MKIKAYLFGLGLVLLFNAGCGSVGGDASPTGPTPPLDTTLSLESSASQVSTNGTFTVTVKAYKVTNLSAVAFDVKYDKTVVDVTSIQDGGFLSSPLVPLYNYNSIGNMVVGLSSQGSGGILPGVTGDGTICTITFKAKAAGSTTISIVSGSAKFSDTNLAKTTPAIGSSVDITVR